MPACRESASANLYVHFPFCRRKCTYCALHSRVMSEADRSEYASRIAAAIPQALHHFSPGCKSPQKLSTIYFGGGSPALCNLKPVFSALSPFLGANAQASKPAATAPVEFTVEMHPLDVTREKLQELRDGGVNRISMGVQSLDDDVLRHMGRGYTLAVAERAFALVKEYFDNSGIDLIVGYPGDRVFEGLTEECIRKTAQGGSQFHSSAIQNILRLSNWGLRHCSVYSLILEESSILARMLGKRPAQHCGNTSYKQGETSGKWGETPIKLHSDDEILDKISIISKFLKSIGLQRYEISNYAVPGYECQHNMATWRGEDYIGLGDGAHGRIGLLRTTNWWPEPWGETPKKWGETPGIDEVSEEKDEIERKIFSLRTREGLDANGHPEWISVLDRFASEGLLAKDSLRYRLTERGTEVCDSILAELV